MQENKHGSVNIPLNTRDFQLLTSPMAWTIGIAFPLYPSVFSALLSHIIPLIPSVISTDI